MTKPNLLYIHSDQHTPYVTGCYGDKIVQTPNLDEIASRGVTFNNTYCPSPICTPSRMSMLTGRYPYLNDCWTNYHTLTSGFPTFAHSMGAAGYKPILFGRMHSIGPDQLRGYSERYVGDHCSNFTESSDVDHGELQGTTGPNRVSLEKSGKGQNAYQVHDEEVIESVLEYFDNHNPSENFNVSIGLMLPHQPYVAKKEDYELYEGKIPMPEVVDKFDENLHPYFKEWRERSNSENVTDEEIIRAKTAYYGLVTAMDKMIGQIISKLKEKGLYENTVIVYSSDHGEQIGEHSLFWKQTFYEYSVKVPCIISYPEKLPSGKVYDEVISSLDLNATMLDLLKCPALPNSNGRTLVPMMTEDASWDNTVFSEYCTDDGFIHRMIRKGDLKYIYYHGMPPQLFDLSKDPMEQNDLSNSPEYQDALKELKELTLEGWDPDYIEARIAQKKEDQDVLRNWAYSTNPPDQYRWKLSPDMDYLEKDPVSV